MINLIDKINEEAILWEKTKDKKHKENWYKLLEQFTASYANSSNNQNEQE